MRRMRGIWPPSNPGRTWPPWRAVWPLPPRPAVLPIPEPGPRPLRMRARCDPTGARRSCSARRGNALAGLAGRACARGPDRRAQIVKRETRDRRVRARGAGFRARLPGRFGLRFWHLLLSFLLCRHLDEMTHLLEHAAQRRMIGVHDDILMVLEAEGLERSLHAIGMAVAGAHLLDAQLP